jgi:hypothetical protein
MKQARTYLMYCALAAALAPFQGFAHQAGKPGAQVEVSKAASSMPGPRYAWVDMPPQVAAEFDKRAQDPKLRQRVQAALDKAMQAKGYRRSDDAGNADFILAYRVGVRDAQQAMVRDTGMKQARETSVECRAGGCSQIVTQGDNGVPTMKVDTIDLVEGGLMVEALKPADVRVLWRALYRGSVRAGSTGSVDLDAVARKTLAQLPKAAVPPR